MALATSTQRLAYLAWLVVCVVWGTTYLGIRIALEGIPPALVGGIRYTLAGLIVAGVLKARRQPLPPPRYWGGLVLLGFLMLGLGNGGVIWAEQWVPSGVAAVVVALSPFWINGLEALLPHGDRLTRRTVSGLLLGFTGVGLLMWPDLAAGGERTRQFAAGLVALQVAAIGWSIGSLYSRRHAPRENPLGSSAMQMFFGGVIMLGIATARGEWAQLNVTSRAMAAEAYLTIVGSIVGYTAYVFALKHLPIATVSLYAYVNPVIAVLLGALVLNEPFGWRLVVASCLVFVGVAIVKGKGQGPGPAPAGRRAQTRLRNA